MGEERWGVGECHLEEVEYVVFRQLGVVATGQRLHHRLACGAAFFRKEHNVALWHKVITGTLRTFLIFMVMF